MIKHPLFDLFAARSIIRGTEQVRYHIEDTVQTLLNNTTSSKGAGASPLTTLYQDTLLFRGSAAEAMSLFDFFALRQMSDWHKTGAGVRGSTVFVQYKAARSFNVRLQPRTVWARMTENMEASHNRRRYDRCIEAVSYEYVMDMVLNPDHSGTRVNYATRETIDAGARTRRDLVKHYAAPSLPTGFGAIGEAFFAELRATGRV
jgi:hypothetical protein